MKRSFRIAVVLTGNVLVKVKYNNKITHFSNAVFQVGKGKQSCSWRTAAESNKEDPGNRKDRNSNNNNDKKSGHFDSDFVLHLKINNVKRHQNHMTICQIHPSDTVYCAIVHFSSSAQWERG